MSNAEAKGLLKAFVSIREQAGSLLYELTRIRSDYIKRNPYGSNSPYAWDSSVPLLKHKIAETEGLIDSFNRRSGDFYKATGKTPNSIFLKKGDTALDYLKSAVIAISQLRIECEGTIGILEETTDSISLAEKNKLEALRKELKELSEKVTDINFEKNIETAIDECEKGHYLASCLIAGRVVSHVIDQIPDGGNKEDKIKHKIRYLEESEIVPAGRKDIVTSIIKADKEARNISTHQISVFPQPSDAYSLLAGSLRLLEIWAKLQETK